MMALAEVADLLGVSRQRAAILVDRPDFPAPIDTLSGWDASGWRPRSRRTRKGVSGGWTARTRADRDGPGRIGGGCAAMAAWQ